MLHHAYEYLKSTPPFSKWNLPDAEDVLFRVTRSRTTMGTHSINNGRHCIEASCEMIGHTDTLMSLMGHEMIHLHMHANGISKSTPQPHGAAFKKFAAMVCKYHGWDARHFQCG